MTSPPAHTRLVSDHDLRSFVEMAFSARRRQLGAVICIERRLFSTYSSFSIEQLLVQFQAADDVRLVFKDLSPAALSVEAQQVRPTGSHHPHCEVWIYREVLAKARLGTAYCYASCADHRSERYWLLLEEVAGDDLGKVGDFSIWQAAAGWLALAHTRLPNVVGNRSSNNLPDYDAACFNRWIDRAQQIYGDSHNWPGDRLSAIEWNFLIDQSRRAATLVDRLGRTIIHGEFYASNILAGRSGDQLRICPIDWETAGHGTGLLDLAAIVAGGWSEAEKKRLAETYWESLDKTGVESPSTFDGRALSACRLLMAMKWIGWKRQWEAPAEHRCDWLSEAVAMANAIDGKTAQLPSSGV